MDVARPYTVFSTPLDLEVLLVLRGTTRPLTGRDIARLVTRGSPAGVQKALRRLASHGIIHGEEAGRAVLYTLNRDHLAVPALEQLAGMRAELEERLRAEVKAWHFQPRHVSMFGSAARGDGDTESDIDLFVVRPLNVSADTPAWRDQLDQLTSDVYRWTGNHLAVSEIDERELRRLEREHPPIADAFGGDVITLVGPPPQKLLVTRRSGRTQPCGAAQARTRLAQARKFLEVAELVATEDYKESLSHSAAVAVLAGIAASDAACCRALGRRSRSDDHRDAAELLRQIHPDGVQAARALLALIDLKDTAHYGLIHVTRRQLAAALRRASSLVDFAAGTGR